MTTSPIPIGHTSQAFRGFEHLDANYIYCPNQFFEVCLRHYSRGVVRLVAYLLRLTLGYLDGNGNPVSQDIRIPYSAISKCAGVSTRAIPKALEDAESGGFIQCVTKGIANSRGQRGQAAEFRLRWSNDDEGYTDDPQQFRGFYAGEGHRSPIPNGYFDIVVRQETLAMAKVVGAVLRHTVGYQNQFGGRRSDATLSYSYIQRFANLGDRTTLSETLKEAIQKGYVCCVSKGHFDPNAGIQSRAARYAVKWLDGAANCGSTVKTRPGEPGHGKKTTGNTVKTRPERDGRNPTDRKTVSKTSYKQQNVVAKNSEGYELLVGEGINQNTAIKLSELATLAEIQNQIKWLEFRNPENRPAMLRKAIEEEWCEPEGVVEHKRQKDARTREKQDNIERAEHEAAIADQKRKRLQRHTRLLALWKQQSTDDQQDFRQAALEQAASDLQRRLIHKSRLDSPAREILEVMALAIDKPIGELSWSVSHSTEACISERRRASSGNLIS